MPNLGPALSYFQLILETP
ncbi:hypothetical protein D037_4968, partial [Vibrio parahaemolyticus IDH02640]